MKDDAAGRKAVPVYVPGIFIEYRTEKKTETPPGLHCAGIPTSLIKQNSVSKGFQNFRVLSSLHRATLGELLFSFPYVTLLDARGIYHCRLSPAAVGLYFVRTKVYLCRDVEFRVLKYVRVI